MNTATAADLGAMLVPVREVEARHNELKGAPSWNARAVVTRHTPNSSTWFRRLRWYHVVGIEKVLAALSLTPRQSPQVFVRTSVAIPSVSELILEWAKALRFDLRVSTASPRLEVLLADVAESVGGRFGLDEAIARSDEVAREVFGAGLRLVEKRSEHDPDFGGDYVALVLQVEAASLDEFGSLRTRFFEEASEKFKALAQQGRAGDLARLVISVRRSG